MRRDIDFVRKMRTARWTSDSITDLQYMHMLIIRGDVIVRHVDEAPAKLEAEE